MTPNPFHHKGERAARLRELVEEDLRRMSPELRRFKRYFLAPDYAYEPVSVEAFALDHHVLLSQAKPQVERRNPQSQAGQSGA